MRDTWFAFNANRKPGRDESIVVWSWDYDGASDVLRTRRPSPGRIPHGQSWPAVVPTSSLDLETPNPYRVDEFWDTLLHASGTTLPSLVMSGSARVVYQTPGKFEQDGLSHVDMQNEGLRRRGYPSRVRIDTTALHLRYAHHHLSVPGFDEHACAKMDIVLRQIRHAQEKLKVKKLLFVFVDDIYASVLAEMFHAFSHLKPPDVTVHLVEYQSFRNRPIPPPQTSRVIAGVHFYPFQKRSR